MKNKKLSIQLLVVGGLITSVPVLAGQPSDRIKNQISSMTPAQVSQQGNWAQILLKYEELIKKSAKSKMWQTQLGRFTQGLKNNTLVKRYNRSANRQNPAQLPIDIIAVARQIEDLYPHVASNQRISTFVNQWINPDVLRDITTRNFTTSAQLDQEINNLQPIIDIFNELDPAYARDIEGAQRALLEKLPSQDLINFLATSSNWREIVKAFIVVENGVATGKFSEAMVNNEIIPGLNGSPAAGTSKFRRTQPPYIDIQGIRRALIGPNGRNFTLKDFLNLISRTYTRDFNQNIQRIIQDTTISAQNRNDELDQHAHVLDMMQNALKCIRMGSGFDSRSGSYKYLKSVKDDINALIQQIRQAKELLTEPAPQPRQQPQPEPVQPEPQPQPEIEAESALRQEIRNQFRNRANWQTLLTSVDALDFDNDSDVQFFDTFVVSEFTQRGINIHAVLRTIQAEGLEIQQLIAGYRRALHINTTQGADLLTLSREELKIQREGLSSIANVVRLINPNDFEQVKAAVRIVKNLIAQSRPQQQPPVQDQIVSLPADITNSLQNGDLLQALQAYQKILEGVQQGRFTIEQRNEAIAALNGQGNAPYKRTLALINQDALVDKFGDFSDLVNFIEMMSDDIRFNAHIASLNLADLEALYAKVNALNSNLPEVYKFNTRVQAIVNKIHAALDKNIAFGWSSILTTYNDLTQRRSPNLQYFVDAIKRIRTISFNPAEIVQEIQTRANPNNVLAFVAKYQDSRQVENVINAIQDTNPQVLDLLNEELQKLNIAMDIIKKMDPVYVANVFNPVRARIEQRIAQIQSNVPRASEEHNEINEIVNADWPQVFLAYDKYVRNSTPAQKAQGQKLAEALNSRRQNKPFDIEQFKKQLSGFLVDVDTVYSRDINYVVRYFADRYGDMQMLPESVNRILRRKVPVQQNIADLEKLVTFFDTMQADTQQAAFVRRRIQELQDVPAQPAQGENQFVAVLGQENLDRLTQVVDLSATSSVGALMAFYEINTRLANDAQKQMAQEFLISKGFDTKSVENNLKANATKYYQEQARVISVVLYAYMYRIDTVDEHLQNQIARGQELYNIVNAIDPQYAQKIQAKIAELQARLEQIQHATSGSVGAQEPHHQEPPVAGTHGTDPVADPRPVSSQPVDPQIPAMASEPALKDGLSDAQKTALNSSDWKDVLNAYSKIISDNDQAKIDQALSILQNRMRIREIEEKIAAFMGTNFSLVQKMRAFVKNYDTSIKARQLIETRYANNLTTQQEAIALYNHLMDLLGQPDNHIQEPIAGAQGDDSIAGTQESVGAQGSGAVTGTQEANDQQSAASGSQNTQASLATLSIIPTLGTREDAINTGTSLQALQAYVNLIRQYPDIDQQKLKLALKGDSNGTYRYNYKGVSYQRQLDENILPIDINAIQSQLSEADINDIRTFLQEYVSEEGMARNKQQRDALLQDVKANLKAIQTAYKKMIAVRNLLVDLARIDRQNITVQGNDTAQRLVDRYNTEIKVYEAAGNKAAKEQGATKANFLGLGGNIF